MQHEVISGRCPVLGERLCGTFPRSVTSSKQYGDTVAAYAALLYYQGKMSFESASTIGTFEAIKLCLADRAEEIVLAFDAAA